MLVLFRGLPGVGKSTLARAVSLELGGAPLVDKDDTRDALAEVFSSEDEEKEGEEKQRDSETFRQRLNEASYASAFNAARTLLACSRCPCVLLDSPLLRASVAERALRLAEELEESEPSLPPLAFVVVAVGSSDEKLWRRRLESRAAFLEESGSFSMHKPRRWKEVKFLQDRGRRELLEEVTEEEEENRGGGEGEKEKNRGGGEGEKEEEEEERNIFPSFRRQMLRDLGVERENHRPSSSPFSRLWRSAFARFVVDTASGTGGEGTSSGGDAAAATEAAARRVAAAVRSALADKRAFDGDSNNSSSSSNNSSVVSIG